MYSQQCLALLRAQHGVITRQQALGAGVAEHEIRALLRRGLWVKVHAGVYREVVARPTWRAALVAACLAHGAVASHRTAARLHGLQGFDRTKLEITVVHGRLVTLDGIVVHQSKQMHLDRRVLRDGISTTSLARTVLDVAAVSSSPVLNDVVDQVIRARRLRWYDLYRVLAIHSQRGRNGCGPPRELLAYRFGETVPLSAWSRMVADLLVAHGLPEPLLEHRICDESGALIAQVDLAYPAHRVVIELDSVAYHHSLDGFERDRARYRGLAAIGWVVLPLTWKQFTEDASTFVAEVRTVLGRS